MIILRMMSCFIGITNMNSIARVINNYLTVDKVSIALHIKLYNLTSSYEFSETVAETHHHKMNE